MSKRSMIQWLKKVKKDMGSDLRKFGVKMDEYDPETETLSIYIGSFMNLDPCGRYHHAISPNGISSRCEKFWENLEEAAEIAGGYIISGEGDATDIFFCFGVSENLLPKEDRS